MSKVLGNEILKLCQFKNLVRASCKPAERVDRASAMSRTKSAGADVSVSSGNESRRGEEW